MKAFIVFCSLFLTPNLFPQNLQFYREDLTFEIKNGYFRVDGIYNFCNNGNKEIQQLLFYPFPLDSLYGDVDSICATDCNVKSKDIIISKTEKGFYFKVDIDAYGVGKYKISYRQKLLKNKAEYILLTTQKWGIPFENSCYKLITPKNLNIISISYTPDSIKQLNTMRVFYWSKKNFMPDKNFIVEYIEK